MEPAARRVLAGREGMGRPPRRFPPANGLFGTPHSVGHTKWRTTVGSDLQSCRSTAATPSTHIKACMTMSVRRRRVTLTHRTRHIRVASFTCMASGPQFGMAGPRGEGGYGIEPTAGVLRAVGGYDTAAEKGTAPYPTGQISGTQNA